jgi:hypothetical protein
VADGYRVAQLDDFELKPWRETLTGRVRDELGITAFGVNSWVGPNVGDRVIPEHAEDQEGDQDELYVVVRGRARFEVGGDTVDAPQGTLVYVPAGPTVRTAFAEEPETIVLAVGATAGKAYVDHGWEPWFPKRDNEAGYECDREGPRIDPGEPAVCGCRSLTLPVREPRRTPARCDPGTGHGDQVGRRDLARGQRL